MSIPMPVEIDDVTLAFPANALEFMPAWEDIPEEFREGNHWTLFAGVQFGIGLASIQYVTKEVDGERIDPNMVWRQLCAIQGSFAPKHEHKIAAVGYLASLWINCLVYASRTHPNDHVAIGEATMEDWQEYWKEQNPDA